MTYNWRFFSFLLLAIIFASCHNQNYNLPKFDKNIYKSKLENLSTINRDSIWEYLQKEFQCCKTIKIGNSLLCRQDENAKDKLLLYANYYCDSSCLNRDLAMLICIKEQIKNIDCKNKIDFLIVNEDSKIDTLAKAYYRYFLSTQEFCKNINYTNPPKFGIGLKDIAKKDGMFTMDNHSHHFAKHLQEYMWDFMLNEQNSKYFSKTILNVKMGNHIYLEKYLGIRCLQICNYNNKKDNIEEDNFEKLEEIFKAISYAIVNY